MRVQATPQNLVCNLFDYSQNLFFSSPSTVPNLHVPKKVDSVGRDALFDSKFRSDVS